MNYKPKQQDIVWINFQPSKGHEIRGRHPAVVISISGYTTLTDLVAVCPITHAKHNHLRMFFQPLVKLRSTSINHEKIKGYVNPLQFYTFDINKRYIQYTGEILPDSEFMKIIKVHKEILDI